MNALKLFILSLVLCIFSFSIYAQCPIGIPYVVNTPAQVNTCGTSVATSTLVSTHDNCYYAGEYGSLAGAIVGKTYCFEALSTDYLTIYDADMTTVLASGTGEVCAVALTDTLIAQINLDSSCGVSYTCRPLRSICQDCPPIPMGCSDPLALNYNCAAMDDGSCIYPGAGNECATALPITPDPIGAVCVPNNVDFNLTDFSGVTPSCENFPIYNDTWYTWNSGTVTALSYSANSGPMNIAVYRNSCGSLTEVECLSSSFGQLGGWSTNEALYIQVYYTSDFPTASSFCLYENCDPQVTADYTCTSDSTFNLEIEVLNMGGASSYLLDISSYSFGNIMDTISTAGIYTYNGMTANSGYAINITSLDTTSCSYSYYMYPYCFCFGNEPPNDLCVNAETLSVDSEVCLSPTAGTLECAFQFEDDYSYCNYYGYYYGSTADVWYTFTAPPSGNVILDLLDTFGGSYYGMYYSILAGSCGSFYEVDCGFSSAGNTLVLSPGVTYTIRVFRISVPEAKVNSVTLQNQYGEFTICLYDGVACSPTLYFSGIIPDGDYIAGYDIYADGTVSPGSDVYFEAGDFIELQSGFSADETFEAVIGGCIVPD